MNTITIFITMILLFIFGTIFDYVRNKKIDTSIKITLIRVILSFFGSLLILSFM